MKLEFIFFTTDKFDIMTEDLMRILSNNNVRTKGKPFLMRYSSPFTLGFMRRNQIGIELEYLLGQIIIDQNIPDNKQNIL